MPIFPRSTVSRDDGSSNPTYSIRPGGARVMATMSSHSSPHLDIANDKLIIDLSSNSMMTGATTNTPANSPQSTDKPEVPR
jgi:hypothetical protein